MSNEIGITIENIGGIDRLHREIEPGLTVLRGRNATNRTSFLQAVMAAFGSESDRISLKSDAEEGRVVVEQDGETYTRTLRRSGESVRLEGDPFTRNPELLDLYAFLLRDNPVRQAVERDQDLYALLMQPVDTETLDAEIEQLRSERRALDETLAERRDAETELPDLLDRRDALTDELASLRETEHRLETKRNELETTDSETAESARADELDDQLRALQTERDRLDRRIERKQAKIAGAREDIESTDRPEIDWDDLEHRHDQLQGRIDDLTSRISTLQELRSSLSTGLQAAQTLQDNQFSLDRALQVLDDQTEVPAGPLSTDTQSVDQAVTDTLVEGELVQCLGCGSMVPADTVEEIIDQYEALNGKLAAQIRSLEREQETIQDDISEIETSIQEYERATDRIENAEESIAEAEAEIESLETDREELTAEIEHKTAELSALSNDEIDETTKQYNEVRDELRNVQVDIDRLESELDELTDTIDQIEQQVEEIDDLETERERLTERIEERRSTVERTERALVSEFNETIEAVLDLLAYDNIERIWLERTRENDETSFRLHIVREGPDGVYECELGTLSESERTVTGLVVSLTGYLVHDVDQHCPVLLLDSLEMIDSERIATLLEYFEIHTEFLIAALLPEDTTAVVETVSLDEHTVVHDHAETSP